MTAQTQTHPQPSSRSGGVSSQTASGKTRAKSIGHYILGKTIGEGTFGKVKLGTHILTGERVAVKVLEKARIAEVADVERVAREVHILKLIRHAHIVQLYEIIETRGQLYLIMEYANGGELFDYIVSAGRVQEHEACRFFHQIIAGVEKIHAMNIVHRDLKPENLLLDDHKSIKIVDFGLSNVFRDGQLLKTACGSPCYAAPEMIAGHSYVPQFCDLWSCGVILFALVCGYLPFEDQNTAALYKKILAADYKPPKNISEAVRDLIGGLLTTDPTRRFTIPNIRGSIWYKQIPEASSPNSCCIPGQHDLEEDVLRDLDNFGFPRDYAVRCLELNKHNHVTTTYYLLVEKKRRVLEKLSGFDPHEAFALENDVKPNGADPHELRCEELPIPQQDSQKFQQSRAPTPREAQVSSRCDSQCTQATDIYENHGSAHISAHGSRGGSDILGPEKSAVSPRTTCTTPRDPPHAGQEAPLSARGVPGGNTPVCYDMAGRVVGVSPRSPPGYPHQQPHPQQVATTPHWSPRESANATCAARYPSSGRAPQQHQQPHQQVYSQKQVDTPRRRSPTASASSTVASAATVGPSTSRPASQPEQTVHPQHGGSGVYDVGHQSNGGSGVYARGPTPVGVQSPSAAAASPSSLVHRMFGKDSPPPQGASVATSASSVVNAAASGGAPTPTRRSPATNVAAVAAAAAAACAANAGGSMSARSAAPGSAYSQRPPTTPRDLCRSTESARRRQAAPAEAPQSARARIGTRPASQAEHGVGARVSAVANAASRSAQAGPMSARGERSPVNRAMSASPPGAVSARDGSARVAAHASAANNSSRVAWNAWAPSAAATGMVGRTSARGPGPVR